MGGEEGVKGGRGRSERRERGMGGEEGVKGGRGGWVERKE